MNSCVFSIPVKDFFAMLKAHEVKERLSEVQAEKVENTAKALYGIYKTSGMSGLRCDCYFHVVFKNKSTFKVGDVCEISYLPDTNKEGDGVFRLSVEEYRNFFVSYENGRARGFVSIDNEDAYNKRPLTIEYILKNHLIGFVFERLRSDGCPEHCLRLLSEVLSEQTSTFLSLSLDSIVREDRRTKYDILSQSGRLKSIPKNINKYPLCLSHMYLHARSLVGEKEARKILLHEEWIDYNLLNLLSVGDKTVCVCSKLFSFKLPPRLVREYLYYCKRTGKVADVNLNMKKLLEILETDNDFLKELKADLFIAEPYIALEKKLLRYGYKLIKTTMKLYLEGLQQRNCVYSYARDINSGYCAIFTKKGFTAEVRYDNEKQVYTCPQYKAFANKESKEEHEAFSALLNDLSQEFAKEREEQRLVLKRFAGIKTT